MNEPKSIPPVTIYPWSNMAMPRTEIQNTLTFLAYKTNKPVTFSLFAPDEGYSENTVSVRIAVADGTCQAGTTDPVKLGGKQYNLAKSQTYVDLNLEVPEDKRILDDDHRILAYVDHNRIIIPIELTAADNESAQVILAYVIEKSVALLDFRMNGKLLEEREKLSQSFCQSFAKFLQKRIYQREEELTDGERKANEAYYTILEFESKKPVIQKELEFLKRLEKRGQPRLFRQQAQALIELQASGQYNSIEAGDDGSISATTGPITIEYDNWQFPLGRYRVDIEPKGSVSIEALDPHPDAEYPHPHVATDSHPCLGNIAADIPKMIGSLRIAEALQVLYQFLSEYNSDNPYEKISHFDPSGQYEDEDDNPCENCDESCSPYCIFECSDNNGQYGCEDCGDYRTDYCYLECSHNEDFSLFSPCDDCSDKGTQHCYLNCQYNDQWQLQRPCDDCEFEECNAECRYFNKSESLKETENHANARQE